MSEFSVGYISFVDVSSSSGPGVNEREFLRWLAHEEPDAVAILAKRAPGLSVCQVVIGTPSLMRPLMHLACQVKGLQSVRKHLRRGAIIYYRHSRLVIIIPLLAILRPDLKVVAVRVSGARVSDSMAAPGFKGIVARAVEKVDWSIRKWLARNCFWIDCVTEVQARTLAQASRSIVHVVPNGVNVRAFTPLSSQEALLAKAKLGVPSNAIVVGYCGGSPMVRGALEVRRLVDFDERLFGVVVGSLSEADRIVLSHPRLILCGQVDFAQVPSIVGVFDIGVAFDDLERADLIGNSNQKVRQYLAVGAYVITRASDISFSDSPYLGINLAGVDDLSLQLGLSQAAKFASCRGRRVDFARNELDVFKLFGARHDAVSGGLPRQA